MLSLFHILNYLYNVGIKMQTSRILPEDFELASFDEVVEYMVKPYASN